MKEETPSKKLPPKLSAGTTSTPKVGSSDEILNALLKINNFDSISRESLDIDLSACVTISADSAASLSSTDFWRVLDENAQTSQLDITSSSEDSNMAPRVSALVDDVDIVLSTGGGVHGGSGGVRPQQRNSFSGTFLRPDPPPTANSLFSPLKKCGKSLEQQQRNKAKMPPLTTSYTTVTTISTATERDKHRPAPATATSVPLRHTIKVEPLTEQQTATTPVVPKIEIQTSTPKSLGIHTNKMISVNSHSTSSSTSPPRTVKSTDQKTVDDKQATNKSEENDVPVTVTSVQVALYKCMDCDGLLLQGEQDLNTHEMARHRILHHCPICERDFEQESGLKKHLKAHRSVETRKDVWKKCPECGKCLKLGSMWMHRKIHSDNKKYGCDICGQKFVQKINLTHHSRLHAADKPYECPECQKRFQERSHLQRHQKYHAQTRSYRCDKCGKMYKTERCLKVHNLVHLEQRPFACNVCEKSFISNSKLKQHSNIHTGERPFKCNYCPRDFTNFPNWLKHTRRRHKVDHKTGEHLENIPSYCSKKSTKTAKAQKANEAIATLVATSSAALPNTTTFTTTTATNNNNNDEASQKAQVKRKKRTLPDNQPQTSTNPPTVSISTPVTFNNSKNNNNGDTITITTSATSNSTISAPVPSLSSLPLKSPKIKRERKQPIPKQLQKSPPIPTPTTTSIPSAPATVFIKKELAEPKTVTGTIPSVFPDLHCLSITSAEELIMEQALEMEECGLYDVPVSGTTADTDNAISSETAAALHFRIKNEFASTSDNIKEEEFIPLQDLVKNRVLCSSLESSPFSSPASIELPSTSTLNLQSTNAPLSALYMPSAFALTSQGSLVTSITPSNTPAPSTLVSTNTTSSSTGSIITSSSPPPLAALQSAQIQTQTLFNHLYLPMTVRMPLLVRPNQVLPSVDTLFFSAHTNAAASLFHSKTSAPSAATTTTQQKL